jgi:hypothetical protein
MIKQEKKWFGGATMANEIDNVMAAATEMQTQIVGIFPQIIVTGTAEKPFYQIMYLENEDGEIHLGFGSYDLAYVFQWLKEDFGVTHASAVYPETLRPKGRWFNTGNTYEDEYCRYDYFECSVCECEIAGRYGLQRYCPGCGAKMEG